MCFVCGQFTCGNCVAAGLVGDCVACGETPVADSVVKFARLTNLVEGAGLADKTSRRNSGRPSFLAIARSNLGQMYEHGVVTDKRCDPAMAERMYRLAAEDGYGPAAFHLGCLLYRGAPGIKVKKREARRFFAAAERSGHPIATYNLATLYSSGRGVTKNPAAVRRLLEVAAEQGHAKAILALGQLNTVNAHGSNGFTSAINEARHHLNQASVGRNIPTEHALNALPPKPAGTLRRTSQAGSIGSSDRLKTHALRRADSVSSLASMASSVGASSVASTASSLSSQSSHSSSRQWAYQVNTLGFIERPQGRIRHTALNGCDNVPHGSPGHRGSCSVV